MAVLVNREVFFEIHECIECGCLFAITSMFQKQRMVDKKSFHCPNGHPQSFVESTEEKLRKELEQKEIRLGFVRNASDQKSITIEQLQKKLKKFEKIKKEK